jgi:hypothetical protein
MIGLEQAIYSEKQDALVARSLGFKEEWLADVQGLCSAFAERPSGTKYQACLFAQPLNRRFVAIVQVADEAAGHGLLFHFLILSQRDYLDLAGDPFRIADRFPAQWSDRGPLPSLTWPEETVPQRTVDRVQSILQRSNGPKLLGGSQALVDGGRMVFERPAPDAEVLRDLWSLLPTTTRATLWPATFTFGNALRFDAAVTPDAKSDAFATYVAEEQAAEYPEGRYELNLQIAAEAADQGELDVLFARRSRAETWRMGWLLLGILVVLVAFGNWMNAPAVRVTDKKPSVPSQSAKDRKPA